MIPKKVWTAEELEVERKIAREIRRQELLTLLQDPALYDAQVRTEQETVEQLLEQTHELELLWERPQDFLPNKDFQRALRHMLGPVLSEDNLALVLDTTLAVTHMRNPEKAKAAAALLRVALDRVRFPNRSLAAPGDRATAVLTTAILMANQFLATKFRNDAKLDQEALTVAALHAAGLTPIMISEVTTRDTYPTPGTFTACECLVGDDKADILVGLWDGRIAPIECKATNSTLNSIKRLNEASKKAAHWIVDQGTINVVPAAVISGVLGKGNLLKAQERGLSIFWSHRISDLTDWINATRPEETPRTKKRGRR